MKNTWRRRHKEKEGEKTHMLVMIDYGMIVLFFGVLLILIVFIASPRSNDTSSQVIAAQTTSPPVKEKELVYSFLLALFVLLFALAWYTQRAQTHSGPT